MVVICIDDFRESRFMGFWTRSITEVQRDEGVRIPQWGE